MIDIKKEKQKMVDKILTDCRVFFAFSNSQFEEGKKETPLEEGDKYISIGAGGYMPKSKLAEFEKGFKDMKAWYKKTIKENKEARRALIVKELANHEAYYTCCIADTLVALGKDFKPKEVWAVFNAERQFQELY